jgi:hypothetical protein
VNRIAHRAGVVVELSLVLERHLVAGDLEVQVELDPPEPTIPLSATAPGRRICRSRRSRYACIVDGDRSTSDEYQDSANTTKRDSALMVPVPSTLARSRMAIFRFTSAAYFVRPTRSISRETPSKSR